jgi:hypothetical protein
MSDGINSADLSEAEVEEQFGDKSEKSEPKEEKLKRVLREEEQAARNWQDADLMSLRALSLRYYDRAPIGDEVEGQSKIVTSEYADTIESIMPALVRVFANGEDIVQFQPDAPGDEQYAAEASAYIPHVLMRENDGFTFIYWFIKDALMYRLSWAAVDIEEKETVKRTAIEKMPAVEWAIYQQRIMDRAEKVGADLEIEVEVDAPDDQDEQADGTAGAAVAGPAGVPAMPAQAAGIPSTPPQPGTMPALGMPQPTYSGTITARRKVKNIVVDNIAPEDGLVSPMARKIDDGSFNGYKKQVTASDLRELGLSQADVDAIRSDTSNYTAEAADRQPNAIVQSDQRDSDDDSERKIWVVVAWVKFDWNEDGISETRRVVYAHNGGTVSRIIENEEWTDGEAPMIAASPILMSHTIEGRSVFDMVRDIQEVGTAVTRGMLDNIYQVNRPRPIVGDGVDLSSFLDWTPGMPIRMRQGVKPSADEISWLIPTPITDKALAVLQWKDGIQQKRTGVTPNNQGIPDAAMNPTATGADIITSAADERVGLIARVLGETAFKRLYRMIYRAVKRRATGQITYFKSGAVDMDPTAMAQNWVTIDPTKWPDDMNLLVDVGNGTGNKAQALRNLTLVGQGQQLLLQAPNGAAAVTIQHAATTFRKLVEAAGYKNTAQFVNTPEQIDQAEKEQAAKPPQQTPEMQAAMAQIQAIQAESQARIEAMREKTMADIENARNKAMAQIQIEREKAGLKAQIDAEEMRNETALDAIKLAAEHGHAGPGSTEIRNPEDNQ